MTENEVIKEFKENIELPFGYSISNEASKIAISALEELEQYRELGTVEECKEAVNRQQAKKPNIWGDGYDDNGNLIYDMYDCPECGDSYEIDYYRYDYCPNCGQKLDWSDYDAKL